MPSPAVARRWRPWANRPIVVKGLVVVALPVVALALSSGLLVTTESARSDAQRDHEAAQAVVSHVNELRASSTAAVTDVSKYFIDRTAASVAAVHADLAQWQAATGPIETSEVVRENPVLAAHVRALRSSSDAMRALVERLLAAKSGDNVNPLFTEAAAANTRFEAALQTVARDAQTRTDAALHDYDRLSGQSTSLLFLTMSVGVTSAIVAMVVFALSIRRRVRLLDANATALGEGRPLEATDHATDELGLLERRLDRAAALLRERERALEHTAETLRESENKLALALESGAMGIWDVDLETGRVVFDDQTLAQHGLTADSFGGTFDAWLAMVHPEDRAAVLSSSGPAMTEGGRWTTSYRAVLADGSTRWIGTSGQALVDETGRVVRLIGVSSDITERKQDEQVLRAAIDAAEQANHAKSDFLSRVSHELRTPLNAILGFGQLLAMDDLRDEQRESVDQVIGAGRHLLALIDDVLAISRIEAGTMTSSVEPVDLGEIVTETIALVSTMATEKRVRLAGPADGYSGVHVMGDRRHIKQILVNLASNAIKFNDAGGSVTFGWSRRTPDTVRVTVADDGPGIAADKLDRIFTPFDRLGAEESTVEGTGIGLALSQRLAELQGAALSVDSEPGRGSTFALDLRLAVDPLAGALDGGPDGADAMTAVTHTEPVVPAGHHGTILYVEDNPSNLRLVQRVLDRRGGIRLVTAGTAHMALSLVARVPIDLVLLDLHLPDLQGDEVLARLRRDPTTASIPVVIVSADASPGRIERLRAAGADDFLTKPLDLAHLLQVVDDRLAGARA